jgi:hypothetical protein
MCISWLPGIGWLAVSLGILGLFASIPSITYWHYRPGYTGWGISGLFLGVWSVSLGLAYQIKYSGGVLDHLVLPLSLNTVALCWLVSGIATAIGLYLARAKRRHIGIFLSASALIAVILVSTWGILTADQAHLAAPERADHGSTSQ